MDRLHRLVDLEETTAGDHGFAGGGGSSSSTAGRGPRDSGADSEEGRSLERACLRAEREGPSGWTALLPRLQAHVEKNPQDAQAWAYLARARAAQGNDREALRAAAEATRLNPSVILGHSLSLLVASNSADSGRWDAAAKAAEAALASQPGDKEAMELLIRALAAQGLVDKAEGTLAVLAQSHGGSCGAALARRLADERGREPTERHLWLSKAVALGRGSERPLRELGEVCLLLQREQEALQWFQKAFQQPGGSCDVEVAQTLARMHVRAGRPEEALDVYRVAVGAVPESLVLQRSYGQLLLKQGRSAEAIRVIQRTARLSPAAEAAVLQISLAELHQGLGQTREAFEAWEAATGLDTSNAAAWRGLAAAAATKGEHAMQSRALQKLMALEPSSADWPARFAGLLLRPPNGQEASAQSRREAEIHLERALGMSPTHAEALLCMGLLKREGPEALEFFERAARADATCREALERAAGLRWARGDRREAVEWYKAFLAQRPDDDGLARCRMATAALLESRNNDALEVLRSVSQRDRPSEEALALLGYLELLSGNVDGSRQSLQQALRVADEEPRAETRLYRALALLEAGDTEAARGEFRRAAELLEPLRRLRDDERLRETLVRGAGVGQDTALALLVPGADAHICFLLESLATAAAGATAALAATPKPPASAASLPPPASAPALSANAVARGSAASGAAPPATVEGDWRDSMYESQAIEVYSKSAGTWLPGTIAQLNPDMVKVKYLIDGQWCEKKLLRSSDSLRVAIGVGSCEGQHGSAPYSPPPRTSPGACMSPQSVESSPKTDRAAVVGSPGGGARVTPAVAPTGSVAGAERSRQDAPASHQAYTPASAAAPPRKGIVADGAAATPGDGGQGSAPAYDSGTPTPAVQGNAGARRLTGDAAPKVIAELRSPMPEEEVLLDSNQLVLGQVLGSGGFGAVYRGTYRGAEVAIKKLHIADGQVSALQIEEFRKEVENLQALRHPRLVSFIGAALIESTCPPSLCIVTEFMPNGSLHALLHTRKEPITFAQRVAIAVQVTEGVVFLHSRSPPFVHRDLKSLNAVLDFQLNVKLCDFGLTQSMEKTHISRRDNEGGSPRYMAPELFDARGKITEKVDVWALGCLVVEILTGRLPHEECNSIQQVMTKVLIQRQMPFVDWRGVSEDLKVLAELSFEFYPTKRIDATRFLEGLKGLAC